MVGMKLAIDFGSANLTIYAENKGVVLCEPSLMICDKYSGKPIAMGEEAKKMRDKLPASMVEVVPIKDGSVSDYDAACIMLRTYINKICMGRLMKPAVLMCVPESVTALEKKTLTDVLTRAGAGRVCFVEEALAAAIGAGVRIREPKGIFICDIGGGISDCAVVSMGRIAAEKTVRVGGNDLTKAIRDYVFREHSIEIGVVTAEEIKRTVGSAIFRTEEVCIVSGGKSCETGLPVLFEITSTEVYWILKSYVEEISECIKSVLENAPVELVTDVSETGILLCGGTANLFGLDRCIEWSVGIAARRAAEPENSAVLGLGKLWRERKILELNGYTFASSDEEE